MIESRLILTDRQLFLALQQETEVRRKELSRIVTKWVIDFAGVNHPTIKKALVELESNTQPNENLRSTVERVLADYDSKYLDLKDRAEEGQASESAVLAAFAQARAIDCLSFTLKNDVAEAVYEACAATGDAKLVRKVLGLNES